MSKNKLLVKDGVITKGGSDLRAVLCYDSGLIYQYDNPENILGMYQKGKGWIILEKPYYSSGGWGSGSSGDRKGHYLISNARELVDAISARRFELNSKQFLSQNDLDKLNKEIEKNNKLIKKQNELAKRLGRSENVIDLTPLETLKVKSHSYWNDKRRTAKGIDPISTARGYENAVKVFIDGKGKKIKVDGYKITPSEVTQGDTVVAFRDSSGVVFMNSQVLNTTSFEREFMGNQSIIQKAIRKIAKYSIPFNVLKAGDLKLNETSVLEQGPESTHTIKVNPYSSEQQRHFTGALLLQNNGRKFLMDIDREEIKHKIFNAFFVEVDKKVKTISEAYESMKPQSVKDAEKAGKTVLRQGEWFFVQTDKELTVESKQVRNWHNENETSIVTRFNISHGKGRPNALFKPVGFNDMDQYVCGLVTHSGREHRDLDLGVKRFTRPNDPSKTEYTTFQLWTLVPNSTVSNFTIQGDID